VTVASGVGATAIRVRPAPDAVWKLAIAARVFTLGLGIAAIAWGATTFPVFWREAVILRTASHIADRDSFKPNAVGLLLPAVEQIEQDSYCRPEAARGAAIVRLRVAENAMAGGERGAIDPNFTALRGSLVNALECAPADAFLWMVLAWLDGAREGLRPEQLQELRLSYQLGPNEGWIAARRNRFALSMFERLPANLADAAVDEFAHLVDSWFIDDAVAILSGPGWPIRERLLAHLESVGPRQRETFARALYLRGHDLAVPGVARRDPRPWD
jgi:hypothetical protein